MKATKEIFDKANRLYRSIGKLVQEGVTNDTDTTGTYSAYNSLVDQYELDNVVVTGEDGKFGINWCWGGEMVPKRYDAIKCLTIQSIPQEECFAIANRDWKDYLVDSHGEEIFSADELRPNLVSVLPVIFRKEGKWGLANRRGEVVIEAKYDKLTPDVMGIYWLELDGKEGLITGDGFLIEPIFEQIELDDNMPIVTYKGQKGYLNENLEFTADADEAISFDE